GLRRDQIDFVVGGDGLAVIGKRTVLFEIALEDRAHFDGAGELIARLGPAVGASGRGERQCEHGSHGCRAQQASREALPPETHSVHSLVKTTRPFESTSRRTGGRGGSQSVELRPDPGWK